jgi:hypothetical protein
MVYNIQNHWIYGISSSPEEGKRFNFRNVVFSSHLEFRTMVKVQNPSDSEHYFTVRMVQVNFLEIHVVLASLSLCNFNGNFSCLRFPVALFKTLTFDGW